MKSMSEKVVVVYGGFSSEREVSLKSGRNVIASLEKQGVAVKGFDFKRENLAELLQLKADLFFLALHGKWGEDGTIQGLLELIGQPYTGSDTKTSAVCFDKVLTYRLVEKLVDLPNWRSVTKVAEVNDWKLFPCVLKPAREGSSIGVAICDTPRELREAAEKLIQEYDALLLEDYILGRELTVSVIELGGEAKVLPLLEIRPKRRFYDWQAKYTAGMTDFLVPASLEREIESEIESRALALYTSLGCRDMARIDGIVKEGKFYFLEVNTIPGLTDLSDLPMSARAAGMTFDQTMAALVKNAVGRNRR